MDFQTLLIGIAVCIISALLIYLISIFGMRERTYEEMIAEQRRQQEQLTQKQRQDKKEKKKKFKKGKGVLEKGQDHTEDKGSQAVEEEEEEENSTPHPQLQEDEAVPKMVELELEPEVIGEEPPRRRGKKNKHKPILVNKDEPTLRASGHATDMIHRTIPPKDVVELKKERERKLSGEKQAMPPPPEHMAAGDSAGVQDLPLPREKKRKDKESKESKREREAAIIPQDIQVEHAAMAAPVEGKRSRKHKDHDHATEGSTAEGAHLLSTVTVTKLSDPDIQALIDVLLSKQSGSTSTTLEWTQTQRGQRGDQSQILKKQLDDREKMLAEQQTAAYTATQRLKGLQQELNNERHKYAVLESQMGDGKQSHAQEIQALHLRMQQTHDSHMQERNQLMMQLEQLKAQCGEGGQIALQRLTQENQQLKEAVAQAQQMANQSQSMEVAKLKKHVDMISSELNKSIADQQKTHGEKKKMESDLKTLQETIGKLEGKQRDTESVYMKKLNEVTEQLRQEKTNNTKMFQDRDRAKDSAHRAEQDLTNLRNRMKDLEGSSSSNQDTVRELERKLEEADKHKSEANQKCLQFEGKIDELATANTNKEKEVQNLKEENSQLALELQGVKQRGSGEGQEAPPGPQGQAAPPVVESMLEEEAVQRSTHDKMVSEKDTELHGLRDELSVALSQLSDVKTELESSKNKNNELRRKNWKAMDAYSEMECRASDYKNQLEHRNSELECERRKLSSLNTDKFQASEDKLYLLENELSTRCEEVGQLKKRVEETEGQLATSFNDSEKYEVLNAELKTLREQKHDIEKNNEVQKTDLEALNSKLTLLGQERDQAVGQLESKSLLQKEELVSLQTKLNSIELERNELSDAKAKIVQHEEEITKLQQQLDFEKPISNRVNGLEGEIQAKDDQLKQLHSQLEDAHLQNQTLKNHLSDVNDANAESNKIVDNEKVEELKKALVDKDCEVVALNNRLDEVTNDRENLLPLPAKLATAENVIDQLKLEVHQLKEGSEQSKSEIENELKTKESKVTNLQVELDSLKTENQALQDKMSINQAAQDELETGRLTNDQELEKAAAMLKEELSNLQLKYKELESQKTDLAAGQRSAAELAQTTEEQLQKQISHVAEMNKQISSLEKEKDDLVREHQEKLNTESESSEKINSLQTTVADLEKKISVLESEKETKDTSAELQDLQTKLKSLETEKQHIIEEMESCRTETTTTNDRVMTLQSDLDSRQSDIEKLQKEVSILKKENHELRRGCEQATVALTAAEKSAEEIAQVQSELNAKASEVSKLKVELEKREQQIHELQGKHKHAVDALTKAEEVAKSSGDAEVEAVIKEMFPGIEVSALSSMVRDEWVRSVEEKIKHFVQESVPVSSESSDNVDTELSEARQTQNRLQAQVEHYKKVLADTESILNKLQNSVEHEEKKWQSKVNTAEEELKKAQQDVEKLQTELQSAKDNPDLHSQVDSLEKRLSATEEEKTQLQSQLNQHLANGTSSQQDIEELKLQLTDTRKQLEHEVQANKQLSQKLAASAESNGAES